MLASDFLGYICGFVGYNACDDSCASDFGRAIRGLH
jgi:hypothetical protein